jgi:ATP-binding cassette, subfamily C, bacterial CydCD
MKPIDPRLFRYARSTRRFFVISVLVGTFTALFVILQAWFLSAILVDVIGNGDSLVGVSYAIVALILTFLARALLTWISDTVAARSAGAAKSELRQAAMSALIDQGNAGMSSGEIAALATRGIDALDNYFSRYLPQLVLAVIVPISIVIVILTQDLISALIVVVTVPLIPIFMILIGTFTQQKVDRQWKTLTKLSGHFLDLISGLPTLKIFGRAQAQVRIIEKVGAEYRSSTMGVLRISFLSSLALELLATLSVALVAVSVGLRLAEGQILFSVGLFILILAPEVYLPLRLIGQHFHAAAEGLGAADKLFTLIESDQLNASRGISAPRGAEIRIRNLEIVHAGSDNLALGQTTFTAEVGTVTAIVGTSGSGKTTLLRAVLGLLPIHSGTIAIGETSLGEVSLTSWHKRIGWLPQEPHFFSRDLEVAPTIRSVVDLSGQASDAKIWEVLNSAHISAEIRPIGLDYQLQSGSGLSGGQLQRIALARALMGDPDILILDEPTAAVDSASELLVAATLSDFAQEGGTVILVAHRPVLLNIADQIVRVGNSELLVGTSSKTNEHHELNGVVPSGSRNW